MKKKLGNKGQFSWVWTVIVSGISLFTITLFWILMDQARSTSQQPILDIGADPVNMAMLDSAFAIAPVVILVSWGLFTWIIAVATSRGGDSI